MSFFNIFEYTKNFLLIMLRYNSIISLAFFLLITSCFEVKQNEEKKKIKPGKGCIYKKTDLSEELKEFKSKIGSIEIRSYEIPFNEYGDYEEGDPRNDIDPMENFAEKIFLNAEQKDSLFNLISAYEKYEEYNSESDCWSPRHLIIFHDSNGKDSSEIQICFECHKALSGTQFFKMVCVQQLEHYKNFFKHIGINKGF